MKNKLKLWLRRCASALRLAARRWMTRQLIKLADLAEERLHSWQVSLRDDLCGRKTRSEVAAPTSAKPRLSQDMLHRDAGRPQGETFLQWEARKSGVAIISKKEARRRRERVTASAFDRRFAT